MQDEEWERLPDRFGFGPADQAEAAELLAAIPGFAELKRSLRERPQLRSFGVADGEVGAQDDWHGGSRRLKK